MKRAVVQAKLIRWRATRSRNREASIGLATTWVTLVTDAKVWRIAGIEGTGSTGSTALRILNGKRVISGRQIIEGPTVLKRAVVQAKLIRWRATRSRNREAAVRLATTWVTLVTDT